MKNWLSSHSNILISSGAVISTLFFFAITISVSQSLTFFWDDYEVIGLILDYPIGQLFMNGAGHFGPVWRIFFTAEVYLFGINFYLYTLTSAALAAIGFWGFAYSLKPLLNSFFWLTIPFSLIYFTSLGVSTQILTAVGSEFTLAFAFAGMASYVYSRQHHFAGPIALLIASGLSLNGSLPVYFAIFAAVVIAHNLYGRADVPLKRLLLTLIGGFGLTILWAAFAAYLGALNPSPYYAAAQMTTLASESVPLIERFIELTRNTFALTLSWVSGPFVPGAIVSDDLMSRLTILIIQYLPVFIITVALFVWAFFVLLLRSKTSSIRANLLQFGSGILPILITAALAAYTRPGAITSPRYGNVWIPTVLMFYLLLVVMLIPNKKRPLIRIVGISCITFLIINAAIGVISAPRTAVEAANADRPRTSLSKAQEILMAKCQTTNLVSPIDEISPQLSSNDFCKVSRFLHQETASSFFD